MHETDAGPDARALPVPPPSSERLSASQWPGSTESHALHPTTLALVVTAAFIGQLSLRSGVGNLAAALAVGVALIALWRDRTDLMRHTASTALSGSALVFALLSAARASTWLVTLNSLMCVALLGASALAAAGSPPKVTLGWITELVRQSLAALFGPLVVVRSIRACCGRRATRIGPVLRGMALAAVPVTMLAALLVSADAAFGEVVTVDVGLDTIVDHGVLTSVVTVALAGLLVVARATPGSHAPHAPKPALTDPRPLGGIEAMIVLGSVAALYALFAVVQLMGAVGQTAALLIDAGVSPAVQARSGYFQLLWAAGLTAGLLGAVMLLAEPSHWRYRRWLGAVVASLTVVLVATAIRRLGLYTDAFGQTTLRWYSAAFAWVLGIVFVLVACALLVGRYRALAALLASVAFGALLVVNAINPEARIAGENISRATDAEVPLDLDYLTRLSADAWPTLLDHHQDINEALVSQGHEPSTFTERCEVADESKGANAILSANLARLRLDCPG